MMMPPVPGESVDEWKKITSSRPDMSVELLRELTSVKGIPTEVKSLIGCFLAQESVWGNTDRDDEIMLNELFLVAWDWVEYMAPQEVKPDLQLLFYNAYFLFRMRLTRSRKGFERTQENTSIAQTVNTPRQLPPSGVRGFFHKIGF